MGRVCDSFESRTSTRARLSRGVTALEGRRSSAEKCSVSRTVKVPVLSCNTCCPSFSPSVSPPVSGPSDPTRQPLWVCVDRGGAAALAACPALPCTHRGATRAARSSPPGGGSPCRGASRPPARGTRPRGARPSAPPARRAAWTCPSLCVCVCVAVKGM